MSRNRLDFRLGWSVLVMTGLLLAVAPVMARQDDTEAPETPESSAAEQREAAAEAVDQLLIEDFEASAGEGYTYDPAGRRDPFQSLLRSPEDQDDLPAAEGIPGLRIDEIDLTGIFVTGSGAVAQIFSAAQGKSYLLREGDQLRDGDVVGISAQEIVFQQDVPGLVELKPYREVVKRLNP